MIYPNQRQTVVNENKKNSVSQTGLKTNMETIILIVAFNDEYRAIVHESDSLVKC